MNTQSNHSPNFTVISLLTLLLALGSAFAPMTFAASGNWSVNADGNWNTAGNWNPAAVPGTTAGDIVGLNTNISAIRTITLDTAATVGTLNIGDPTSSYFRYTLSGSSTLTFDNSGSAANLRQVTSGGANDSLSVPVSLTDNLTIFNVNGLTNSGVISGSGKGITKAGNGTLTLNGSDANTYTGPTTVTAGTLLLDLGNLSTPTDLINNGSSLTLGGGTLQVRQKSATTSSQTFNGTTVNADSTTAVIGTQVTSGALTIDLGAITVNSGGAVDFTVPTGGAIKTSNTNVNGILGGWATTNNTASGSTVGGWAANDGSGNIIPYSGYTSGTPSGVNNANNYRTTGSGTVSANTTVNSLIISGAGGDTTINSGVTLTLSSGGLFIGGSQRWLQGSGSIKSGLASGELYLHCNNGTYSDYRIYPVIADGSVATKVIKDGPGELDFYSSAKTYTGGTIVNGGTLDILVGGGTGGIRGSVTINPGATLNLNASDALGYTSASVSVTNVNIVGGTLDNDQGNQGYYTAFNLTGGSMTDGNAWTFGSAAYSAINSFASPVVSTIAGSSYIKGDVVNLPITVESGSVPNGIDLVISGVIAGDSGKGITKSGSGTLQLSAANTFTGTNTVSGGTLYVTGTLRSSTNFLVQSNSTFRLDASNILTPGHSIAMANSRLISVDNATLLFGTNFSGSVGNITLRNGATWTSDRPVAGGGSSGYDALLANTSTGAATVLVTNTSGATAATMNGSGGVRLENVQQFDIADVTGSSASDLNVSLVLADKSLEAGSTNGGINKLGLGTMTLSAANTYSNVTVINAGTLALTSGGSINNSRSITLNSSGATFDVSGATFTLGANQPLIGFGNVVGSLSVASGGNITATNSGGNLSFGGLTFNGNATNNVRPGVAYLIVTNSNGLTASGAANSVKINLGAGALTAGTYTLIDYNGTIQGTGFSAFQLGTTPGGLFTYTLVDNVANSSVDLLVEVAADVWTGAFSSEWSTAVLSSPKNWKYSGSPADYVNGTDVLFDDTVTGTTTVDLSVADVTPASVLFNNVNSNYTLQGSAAIAGTIGLTKTGAGSVTINNTNKFVGAVTISAGTVAVGNIANKGDNSALGAGTNITLGGATLSYTGGSAGSDRPIVMTTSNTLNVPSGATSLTLAGAVSGAFTLTKTGAGTLVLDNTANSYGATTMNEGTVSVSNNLALGSSGPLNFGGGRLEITGTSAFSSFKSCVLNAGGGTIKVDNTAGATLNAAVSGAGDLTKTGDGTLTLSAINTYTGGTVVNQGTLTLGDGGSTGCVTNTLTINPGATVNLAATDALGYGTGASANPVNIAGGTLNNGSAGNNGFNSVFNLTGGTASSSGGGAFNFDPDAGAAINSLATNTVSTISGGVRLRGNGLTITTAAGTVPSGIDLNISGAISQSSSGYGIVKAGAGCLRLSTANTYSGNTSVGGGTLLVDGSLSSSSAVTVSNNATLSGTGTVNGPVTLQLGATLAAGGLGTNIGTLSISNAITLNASSTNFMRISKTGGTVTNDQVKGWTGTLSYAGTLQVVDVTSDATPLAYNDKFILFKNGAGNYGVTSFATTNLPALPPGLKWDLAGLLVDGSILVAYENQATTPTINPGSGNYVGSPSVTISSDPGATILYTLDGSTPNSSSASGASPLIVVIPTDAITVLKAIATNSGAADSLMASATYNVVTTPTWTNLAGGSWTTAGNWSNSVVATGTNVTADFSKLTLPAATTVTLDGAQTIGHLTFGDVGNTYGWTLNTGSGGPLSLAVTGGSPTVNVVNQSATINTVLAGTSGLTKTGSGLLTLGAINTYAGGTVVNDGALSLLNGGADAAIRGSVMVNPGANLRLSTVNALGYDTTATAVTNVNVVGGSVSNVTSGDQGYFTTYNLTGGSMQGGSGFWIFGSAANGGINSLASSNASAVSGNFYLKGDVANLPISTEAGSVPGGVDLEISGVIDGDSGKGIAKSGLGTLRLSTASGNTFSGTTTVSGGTLEVTGYNGLLNSSSFTASSGGILKLNGENIFNANHGATVGNSRVITADNATLLMDTNCVSRFGNVTLKNGSTWTCNSGLTNYDALLANTSSGAATVLVTNTSGTSASIMSGSGGIHIQGVQNFNVADVTGDAAVDLAVDMILDGPGTEGGAAGGINKLGAGTMVLSAVNTYNGNTTVNAGSLTVTNNGSLTNSPIITVASGATFGAASGASVTLGAAQTLRGEGAVTGVFTNNGTITPGTASIGTLTFGDAPTLAGTIVVEIDEAASPNADKIVISSGTLDFGGTLTVTNLGGTPTNGTVFDLFDGTLSGSFATVNLPVGGAAHWLTTDLNAGGTIQFTNNPPTTTNLTVPRIAGFTIQVNKSNLAFDLDGDALSFTLSTTTNGATLTQDANYIYVPASSVDDQFTATINDPYFGTNATTVTVVITPIGSAQGITYTNGGTATVGFAGIPTFPYAAERATNVTFIGLLRTWTTNAPANGLFQIEDDFSDIGGTPAEAYYRMRYNP